MAVAEQAAQYRGGEHAVSGEILVPGVEPEV